MPQDPEARQVSKLVSNSTKKQQQQKTITLLIFFDDFGGVIKLHIISSLTSSLSYTKRLSHLNTKRLSHLKFLNFNNFFSYNFLETR